MCKKLLLMCRQNLQNLNLRHSQKKSWLAKTLFFKLPTFHPYSTVEPSITEIKFLLYHAAFCRMKNRRLSFRPNKARRALTFFFTFLHLEQKVLDGPKTFLIMQSHTSKKVGEIGKITNSIPIPNKAPKMQKYVRDK